MPFVKKTGFYFYMKELQAQEKMRGVNVTMKNMPQFAHPKWKRLSEAEKAPYDAMADQYNKDPAHRGGKLASDGTSVDENKKLEMEELAREKQRKKDVFMMVVGTIPLEDDNLLKTLIPTQTYFFIAFNTLVKTDRFYMPNEVGIVEYSVKDGIIREYHRIMHPGRIPTGYAGDAKRLSEKHKMDPYNQPGAEQDLSLVYDDIADFLKRGNIRAPFPSLFTPQEMIETTDKCLEFLADARSSIAQFKLYDATYLLMELRAAMSSPFTMVEVAAELFKNPAFTSHPSTRCEFHDNEDCNYCALAYCKSLCYTISDAVCGLFGVELTEKHIPSMTSEEKPYVITPALEPRRVTSRDIPSRLDQRSNYRSSNAGSERDFSDTASVHSDAASVVSTAPSVSLRLPRRQPLTACLAATMKDMNIRHEHGGQAVAPGIGIGRGRGRPT